MLDLTLIVPIIMAIVTALKTSGMDSKWSPLTSIGLGILILVTVSDSDIMMRVFEGLVAGLTASGLYSGTKATLR